jgi:hypothetical protein
MPSPVVANAVYFKARGSYFLLAGIPDEACW